MTKVKITIVDDSATFREGLRFYIEKILNHEVVAEASNGLELLNIINEYKTDAILMDIEMPGLNGIETTRRLMATGYYKIIAVTNYDEPAYMNELVFAGFKGCIIKKNLFEQLEKALKFVLKGDIYFPDNNLIKPNNL